MPSESHLAFTGPGSTGFSFTIPDSALDFLAQNETLTVVYPVTLTDGNGNSLTQQVIVTLTGANDLPMISVVDPPSGGGVIENANTPTETASGTIAFHDVDLTDTHVVSAAFKSTDYSSQLGTLSAVITSDTTGSGSGQITWTFTANDSTLDQLAAGQTVHETYTVTLNDQHGGVVTQDVTVTITGTEDAPDITVGAGDSAAVLLAKTNAALSTTGTLTVTDLDLSDSVTPTVNSVSLSAHHRRADRAPPCSAMLSVSPASIAANPGDANNLNWSFNSGSQVFNFLAVGKSLTLTYTVKADDGHGGCDNQTVTVTVTGTQDDAPDITVGAGDSAARTLVETNAALSTRRHAHGDRRQSLRQRWTPTVASVSLSGTTGGLDQRRRARHAVGVAGLDCGQSGRCQQPELVVQFDTAGLQFPGGGQVTDADLYGQGR